VEVRRDVPAGKVREDLKLLNVDLFGCDPFDSNFNVWRHAHFFDNPEISFSQLLKAVAEETDEVWRELVFDASRPVNPFFYSVMKVVTVCLIIEGN